MIKKYLKGSIDLKNKLIDNKIFISSINDAVVNISECFKNGNKILVAGNGGSAADAQHFAGEIVCRFKKERKGYPAISLNSNTSIITAWGNDYEFRTIFSRQVEALGNEGDIFIGISTSGNSENVIEAVKKAKENGLKTICLLGKDGGLLRNLADISIVVSSNDTPRIQEVHILIIHAICEEIEKDF